MINDAMLNGWVDGTLPPEQAARVAAAIDADPALAARIEARRAARDPLHSATPPIVDRSASDAGEAAADRQASAQIFDLGAKRAAVRAARAKSKKAKPPAPPRPVLTPSGRRRMMILAALVAGGFGGYLLHAPPAGPVESRDHGLVASAPIARALDSQIASAAPTPGRVRVLASFRDEAGRLCRGFSAPDGMGAGVACRRAGAWGIRALFIATAAEQDAARAIAAAEAEVNGYIATILAGDPLNGAEERRAIAAKWALR